MTRTAAGPGLRQARPAAVRFLCFFAGWIVLGLTGPADLAAGAVAALLATPLSLRLLPPAGGSLALGPALAALAGFAAGSVAAALDVARRVLDPTLPIAPGVVTVACATPPGTARQALRALLCLQPGTLPMVDAPEAMTLHCLDLHAPVARAVAADEARFSAAVRPEVER